METYTVKIYRHNPGQRDDFVGVIEKANSIEQHVFTNFEELWDSLRGFEKTAENSLQ